MDSSGRFAKVATAGLASVMLAVAVAKAQGCEHPRHISPTAVPAETTGPADPVTEVTPAAPARVAAPPPAADAGADAGVPDAGTPEAPSILDERHMLPATKSGAIFRADPPPQQQAE